MLTGLLNPFFTFPESFSMSVSPSFSKSSGTLRFIGCTDAMQDEDARSPPPPP
jgi:hypothetical protein